LRALAASEASKASSAATSSQSLLTSQTAQYQSLFLQKNEECAKFAQALTGLERDAEGMAAGIREEKGRFEAALDRYRAEKKRLKGEVRRLRGELGESEGAR
ncbi:hypothetical protein B484DRAFT_404051, partial [Ochromonadaceae sp. CCMP2298]